MTKSYKIIGTNKRGECITCKFQSANKPNTKAWLAEVDEAAADYWGVEFTNYSYGLNSGGGRIRKH